MGYCIEMTDNSFIIRKESFNNGLNSLKSIFVPENMTCYDYFNGKKYPHFSWVTTDDVLNSVSLGEALRGIRYKPIYNIDGDIVNVEFYGEKYGDEEIFFKALAPYVETGSYLCFQGEDDTVWKWDFKDGKVVQI